MVNPFEFTRRGEEAFGVGRFAPGPDTIGPAFQFPTRGQEGDLQELGELKALHQRLLEQGKDASGVVQEIQSLQTQMKAGDYNPVTPPTQVRRVTPSGIMKAGAEGQSEPIPEATVRVPELDPALRPDAPVPEGKPMGEEPEQLSDDELIDALNQMAGGETEPDLTTKERKEVDDERERDAAIERMVDDLAKGKRTSIDEVGVAASVAKPAPSLYERARRHGVRLDNAIPAAARFHMNAAMGMWENPPDVEVDIVRRNLERDMRGVPVDVRYDKNVGALEWKKKSETQWSLLSPPGIQNLHRDLAAAAPDLLVSAAGVAGTVGSAAAYPTSGLAGPIGAAFTEGMAESARLLGYREAGRNNFTDYEIFKKSFGRGILAGAGQALTEKIWNIWRAGARGTLGIHIAPFDPEQVVVGRDAVRQVQSDVLEQTGQAFPLTSGQVMGAPQALKGADPLGRGTPSAGAERILAGERAARRQKPEVSKPIHDVDNAQDAAFRALDAQLFPQAGDANAVKQAGDAVQDSVRVLRDLSETEIGAEAAAARGNLRTNVGKLSEGGYGATGAVEGVRNALKGARERVFAPFAKWYDQLEAETGEQIYLDGYRKTAAAIDSEFVQGIHPSISRDQGIVGKLLSEAQDAGLTVKVIPGKQPNALDAKVLKALHGDEEALAAFKNLVGDNFDNTGTLTQILDRPFSLKEVNQTLSDMRTLLGGTALDSTPKVRAIITKLKTSLEAERNASLTPGTRDRLIAVESAYREAQTTFRRSIVGRIIEEKDGVYTLNGEEALDAIMESPVVAREFVKGLSENPLKGADPTADNIIPGAVGILQKAQRAVGLRLYHRFYDQETGEVNTKALGDWMDKNGEVLDALYGSGQGFPNTLGGARNVRGKEVIEDVRNYALEIKALAMEQKRFRAAFDEQYGVYSGEPMDVVNKLLKEGKADELRGAFELTRDIGGEAAVESFRLGLAAQVRRMITGSDGKLTAAKMDTFLQGDVSQHAFGILGEKARKGFVTMRNMLRLMEQEPGAEAQTDLAKRFGSHVANLQGWRRFLRGPFPPMSPRGRYLWAALGVESDMAQKIMAQTLADPAKLIAFGEALKLDPLSRAGKAAAARLGFQYLRDAHDYAKREGLIDDGETAQ